MGDEKFQKAFTFGDLLEGGTAKPRGEEESFRQIYGPRTAAVEQRLKAHAHQPLEPTAEEKAKAILEAAGEEAVAIREKARREGFEKGEAEGRDKLARATERMNKVAVEIASVKPRLFAEAEEEVTALVCEIAQRIMGPLVSQKPDCVVNVVSRALSALSERENVTIRVNPGDLALVLEVKPDILAGVDGARNVTFQDDHGVEPGGCMIETPSTELDARIKTQLDEIVRLVCGAK